jgi:hypothetical protein
VSLELETARAETAEYKQRFLKLHREACEMLGHYFRCLERATELTNKRSVPLLGPLPEDVNQLQRLRITEAPLRSLLREGYAVVDCYGYDQRCDVAALEKR